MNRRRFLKAVGSAAVAPVAAGAAPPETENQAVASDGASKRNRLEPNIPIWGVRPGAARDPERPGDYFRAMMDELHGRYPEKPILVTEFGHPCFAGTFGGQFGEDTQARLIEHAFDGMDAPYCCGATIWCYADHLWPESPYFHALMTSNFGVVTRERRPRQSYATVQRLFRMRQSQRGKAQHGRAVTALRR